MENMTNNPNKPKLLWRLILPAAVLVIGLVIAFILLQTGPKAKPRTKVRNATLVTVQTIEIGPQKSLVHAMGTTRPSLEVLLKPRVNGEVIGLNPNFLPGGYFRKGESLLQIDPADYRLAARQLASEVTRVEAEILLEQGNQLVARKEYALLGEQVSDEEKLLMLRQPQIDSLHASLEAARARLEQARVDLQRTEISAPFNAVVESRDINIGTRVTTGSPLATLFGTDVYWVEVTVPVSQLRWIKIPREQNELGSTVKIFNPSAWGESVFRYGTVVRLAAGLEEKGRMARLLVEVRDPLALQSENKHLPQMLINSYVQVEIEGEELAAVATINRDWIRDGHTAWIMDAQDRLDIRQINIVFKGRNQVLVDAGIQAGERLVTSNIPTPVQGMTLRLGEQKTAAAQSGLTEKDRQP